LLICYRHHESTILALYWKTLYLSSKANILFADLLYIYSIYDFADNGFLTTWILFSLGCPVRQEYFCMHGAVWNPFILHDKHPLGIQIWGGGGSLLTSSPMVSGLLDQSGSM